jgi:hypothetical protein
MQHNLAVKANAVAKLTYLQMLGYDVSWAGFNIIGRNEHKTRYRTYLLSLRANLKKNLITVPFLLTCSFLLCLFATYLAQTSSVSTW